MGVYQIVVNMVSIKKENKMIEIRMESSEFLIVFGQGRPLLLDTLDESEDSSGYCQHPDDDEHDDQGI